MLRSHLGGGQRSLRAPGHHSTHRMTPLLRSACTVWTCYKARMFRVHATCGLHGLCHPSAGLCGLVRRFVWRAARARMVGLRMWMQIFEEAALSFRRLSGDTCHKLCTLCVKQLVRACVHKCHYRIASAEPILVRAPIMGNKVPRRAMLPLNLPDKPPRLNGIQASSHAQGRSGALISWPALQQVY